MRIPFACLVTVFMLWATTAESGPIRSSLYPADWTPGFADGQGRFLPDISYAGYHNGETPLPPGGEAMLFDAVTGYGADNTGDTDATAAIQAAIDAAQAAGGGVVYFPPGMYRCDGVLAVTAPRVVLRGAGPDASRIYFTKYAGMEGKVHLSFHGGPTQGAPMALAADGVNGANTVYVADAGALAPGDDISVGWTITEEFVAEHGMTGTWTVFLGQWKPVFRRTIVSVDRSVTPHAVVLDVPLRYPVKLRDGAAIRPETNYIEECGLEHLGLSNAVAYESAWDNERQHLAGFQGAKDCWIRNIVSFASSLPDSRGYHLQNSGFRILACKRMTIAECRLEKAQNRGSGGCGYLYEISTSNEILLRDCLARDGRHNFIQNWDFGTTGCVFLRCFSEGSTQVTSPTFGLRIPAYCEYHHSLAMACLVDACTLNDGWYGGNRELESSGAGHTVTQSVYWNTAGAGRIRSWQYGNGYVIGTEGITVSTTITSPSGELTAPEDWVEGAGLGRYLVPQSLYEDQLARRLGGAVASACETCLCYQNLFEEEWIAFATATGFSDAVVNLTGSGIPERWTLHVATTYLCDAAERLHPAMNAAYFQHLSALHRETAAAQETIAPFIHVLAVLLAANDALRQHLIGTFELAQPYSTFADPAAPPLGVLSGDGNSDGDAYTNEEEYAHILANGGDMDDYAAAVLSDRNVGFPMPLTSSAGLAGLALFLGALGRRAVRFR